MSTPANALVDPGSVTPLEEFPLAWRFTSARHALPPAETAARLMPLDRRTAAQIANEAIDRDTEASRTPLSFRTDEAPGAVRRWLLELPVDASAVVVLSWNRATALVTDWTTFVAHWDDFCYPASDDVTIWSPNGAWTLSYRHYEVFQFG
jgi:hypothetical protein